MNKFKLLKKIKKAQMEPCHEVYIDHEKMELSAVLTVGEKRVFVSIAKYGDSLVSMLNSLQKDGLVEVDESLYKYCKVTYDGWQYNSLSRKERLKYVFHSILVPLFVALATSLLVPLFTKN